MSNAPLPTLTPNVIIENPTVRKVMGNLLAAATLVLYVLVLVDGAIDAFNLQWLTQPAAVIVAGLLSIFQLTVTSSNVPSIKSGK